jgi:hypothetical protein
VVDGFLASVSWRTYRKHPFPRPLHEILGTNIRAVQIKDDGVSVKAQDQIVEIHSAAHVSRQNECKSAEHAFFDYVGLVSNAPAPSQPRHHLKVRENGNGTASRLDLKLPAGKLLSRHERVLNASRG